MHRTLVPSGAIAVLLLVGIARGTTARQIVTDIISRSGLDPELVHIEEGPDLDTTALIIEDEDYDLVEAEIEDALNDLEAHREIRSHRWA